MRKLFNKEVPFWMIVLILFAAIFTLYFFKENFFQNTAIVSAEQEK